ncbi:MAG: dTDP-glucose 4,6-dehydratase [Oligoflexales bacterium]
MKTWLVTGGAGFIGGNFVLQARKEKAARIINLDKLTYAGNMETLAPIKNDSDHVFVQGDIGDFETVSRLLQEYKPQGIFNFAAESHVDRSITGPAGFIETNLMGSFQLLEATRKYWTQLAGDAKKDFRFLHVSTDEVYGSLSETDPAFTETTPYAPNSPYSASKAGSDHLVRAYHHTYGLPTLVTNCSNNYGPYQFPEKLIPLCLIKAMEGKPLPVYGDGQNVRDWLYVEDHVKALLQVMKSGRPGQTYNVGGLNEVKNIDVVTTLCRILDEHLPRKGGGSYSEQITFVTDRPGHDRRYAIDCSKLNKEIGWGPQESFSSGLAKTVNWYLTNQTWWKNILDKKYQGERLGIC